MRRTGWAYNVGEIEEGLNAVAAPVFDAFKRCQAAISVDGPFYRMSPHSGQASLVTRPHPSGQLRFGSIVL